MIYGILYFSHIHIEPVYLQLLVFLIGISCTSLGAGLYLVSDFPVNPIDHMMVCISERFHISIAVSKYIVEGSGMALGLLLKGPVGIGTILMILVFGPMIQFFKQSEVLLQKYVNRIGVMMKEYIELFSTFAKLVLLPLAEDMPCFH